jgi:hypothetical protein
MAFNKQELLAKLRGFRIRNIRVDQNAEYGTKRIRVDDVLDPISGKLLLGCTDERQVKAIVDPRTNEEKDKSLYTIVRAGGASLGLVDAVRNVRVTIQRADILSALTENEVVIANHTDTHAKEGELTGCGYAALRAFPESGSIFDRPSVPVSERIKSFEEVGALRIVLQGDHVAQGFFINPLTENVLKPEKEVASHAFFSLDLGIYKNILHWIQGALNMNDEVVRSVLVKLTRNNLAAVFILSDAEINEAIYIERNDEEDMYFAGILHEALAELKDREGPVMHVLEERMG